jgi:hypothetical protein
LKGRTEELRKRDKRVDKSKDRVALRKRRKQIVKSYWRVGYAAKSIENNRLGYPRNILRDS